MAEEEVLEQETKTKKSLTPRQKFWIRFLAYAVFALVLPCVFIVWRFELFKPSSTSIGGWGFILVFIIVAFASSVLRWVYKGMKFCWIKQVLSGTVRLILPLCALLGFLLVIKDNINLMVQTLSCIIAFEMIGIAVNPLPQWYYDTKGEEIGNVMDMAIDKYFTRKKEEEKK